MAAYSTDIPPALRSALDRVLAEVPASRLGQAVGRLMAGYRETGPAGEPLLRARADVVAYAAYRMPATYAAVRTALGQFAALAPHWRPHTHVDVGGGTGAAAWAAADAWPTITATTVLDRAEPALDLGRELAASSPALGRRVRWCRQAVGEGLRLPEADLVTVSYLLGEVAEDDRRTVVEEAAARGQVVAVVEPGTPAGYARTRAARDVLVAAGMSVAAPCPHSGPCPIVPGEDWCHFAVRLPRSAVHRQLKGGSLGYEDEKFCYVVAAREPVAPAGGRVLRHPVKRKGLVEFEICAPGGAVVRETVTKKRHPELYRKARDTAWGAAWPPGDR